MYVQSDPILLADIFEDLGESIPGLAWITLLSIHKNLNSSAIRANN